MTPSIVVLGASGMLGHKMLQVLKDSFPGTIGTVRGRVEQSPLAAYAGDWAHPVIEDVDALKLDKLELTLASIRPQFIVNCIGTIKQREAATDPIESITINSLLPHRLSGLARDWNGRVIHFSTDCVFSGTRGNYTEDDPSDARDLYGRTKYLGEIGDPNSLTIRTSIIGRELSHGTALLEWFLGQEGRTVRGFTRAWWSGVTTLHLSKVVSWLIAQRPNLTGVFQLSSGRLSKYDLLVQLRDAYRIQIDIEADDSFQCDRSLRGDSFAKTTGYVFPGWPQLLEELVADPTPYGGTVSS